MGAFGSCELVQGASANYCVWAPSTSLTSHGTSLLPDVPFYVNLVLLYSQYSFLVFICSNLAAVALVNLSGLPMDNQMCYSPSSTVY